MSKDINPKAIGMIALAAILVGGGATYWQFKSVTAAKAKVAALEAEIPSEEELKQQLSDSSAKLVEFEEKVQHLEAGVPDIAYVPTLMKELEQIGIDLNIDVIGVRPVPLSFMASQEEKQEDRTYDEIEIEVTIRGLYVDSKRFLDELQNFPKIVAVTKINITPQRETGNKGKDQVETKIFVNAYVFPFDFATSPSGSQKSDESDDQTVASITIGAGS